VEESLCEVESSRGELGGLVVFTGLCVS